MGDVFCATCREPFDSYHMRNDAIHDTDLGDTEFGRGIIKHLAISGKNPLTYLCVREAFARAGWKFTGNSLLAIVTCSCCKANAEQNGEPDKTEVADRTMRRAVLADVLGGDEDGLQSMLEDMEEME